MINTIAPRIAVACYWSPHLVLVLLHNREVLGVRRTRVRARRLQADRLRERVYDFFAKHLPDELVVEERLARYLSLPPAAGGVIRVTSIEQAKHTLLPGATGRTHLALCRGLLTVEPALRTLLSFEPTCGPQIADKSWQTVTLLAIALGLAAQRTMAG